MLALEEKARSVVLLKPDFLLLPSDSGEEGKTLVDDIIARFEEQYLEVKCTKQVFLSTDEAENFLHHVEPSGARDAAVAAFTRGICHVLVLEHLDGVVISRAAEYVDLLIEEYSERVPAPAMLCSRTPWECAQYLEFFFQHLDTLPVERTLAVIKPDGMAAGTRNDATLVEAAEARAADAGLLVVCKMHATLNQKQAKFLCEGLDESAAAMGVLMGEPGAVAMCLEGRGAIGRWQLICGPPDSAVARQLAPTTLRAIWGTDEANNAVHASTSFEAADREIKLFFPEGSCTLQNTLCIIKPDAMPNLLHIRAEILAAGFTILREREVQLTEERATEFYKSQEDTASFSAMVKHAISGPCVVMVLCRLEAIEVLKQLVGPASVKDAKRLRPKSLRARYGRDAQRNAVYCSDCVKSASSEVRFFFPQTAGDPVPDDDEVRDFIFRKSAVASRGLKNLSPDDAASCLADQTLQQLLSQGLNAVCQARPSTSLGAIKWLSEWLAKQNPNKPPAAVDPATGMVFNPPERPLYVTHGVNKDGLPFSVEMPPPVKKKKIIDVDVSENPDDYPSAPSELTTPPHVIFVCGIPGTGKEAACAQLCEEFNFVRLSVAELAAQEGQARTFLGTEIVKHQRAGTMNSPEGVMVTLQLLKKSIVKYQDTNRFLLDGFPQSLEQAKRFEQEIGQAAFLLHFDGQPEVMRQRLEARAAAEAEEGGGGAGFDAAAFEKEAKAFAAETAAVVKYYHPIGKVRTVNAEQETDEAYAEARRYFLCRFVYLLGPPGAPVAQVAEKMETNNGYSSISLMALLERAAAGRGPDVEKIKEALELSKKGKPADASVVGPLIVGEVFRDMALGIQNFVLCDFPQSQKQAKFLEFRVPCVTKTLVLDFSRADAEDLASGLGGNLLEIEMRTAEFFQGSTYELLQSGIEGLHRVPCSLAGIIGSVGMDTSGGRNQKVIDITWEAVRPKVTPGLTIVLGLPGSNTEVLAGILAEIKSNVQVVDCSLLLDRELERHTEAGTIMHNMLARGQVVPFSMTVDLLKDIVNLTCSDSLIVTNCPAYVDQIEYLTKDFRIDRVFFIDGTPKAVDAWQKEYVEKSKEEDAKKVFRDLDERTRAIAAHFARIGKLERFAVNGTPKQAKLEECKKAMLPQFAVVTGVSKAITSQQASMLASRGGAGPPITKEFLKDWAQSKLSRTVDTEDPREFFSTLKKYADTTEYPLLVLERYPAKAEDAAEFVAFFGEPRVMCYIDCDETFLMEEQEAAAAEAAEAGDGAEPETVGEEAMTASRASAKGVYEEFSSRCPAVSMLVPWSGEKKGDDTWQEAHDTVNNSLALNLRPQVYIVVAPSINDFANLVANQICNTKREPPKKPTKFTVVDSSELMRPGLKKPELEQRLAKYAFAAEAPDCLPKKIWIDLFKDAFAQAQNPIGTFLVTNFPTASAVAAHGNPIWDQFNLMEEAADVVGVLVVNFSEPAFKALFSEEELEAYLDLQDRLSLHVNKEGKGQFESSKVCEIMIDAAASLDAVTAKIADEFQSLHDRAEQGPRPATRGQ